MGIRIFRVLHVDEGERSAVRSGACGVSTGGLTTYKGVVGLELEIVPGRLELKGVGAEARIGDIKDLSQVDKELLIGRNRFGISRDCGATRRGGGRSAEAQGRSERGTLERKRLYALACVERAWRFCKMPQQRVEAIMKDAGAGGQPRAQGGGAPPP